MTNIKILKAVVHCFGDCCEDAGNGGCTYGCQRCGACIDACPAQAISFPEGRKAAKVDFDVCTGCGNCVETCPQNIISLAPRKNTIKMLCANHDPAKAAREVCSSSCIGCGACEKNCPSDAIHVVDNCAVIEVSRCISCGMCTQKCPRSVLRDVHGILTAW